jgi:hypothetical protein
VWIPDGLPKGISAALSQFVLHGLGDEPASVPLKLIDLFHKVGRQGDGYPLHHWHA